MLLRHHYAFAIFRISALSIFVHLGSRLSLNACNNSSIAIAICVGLWFSQSSTTSIVMLKNVFDSASVHCATWIFVSSLMCVPTKLVFVWVPSTEDQHIQLLN